MERFSITISSQMKRQLEQMAKVNFRNLNGEINKALHEYISQSGASVVIDKPKESNLEPQLKDAQPIKNKLTPPIHQNEPICTTLLNNDEIEEF